MGEGIYPNLPYSEYVALPGLRVSTLQFARYSAKHLKWAMDGKLGKESTDALRLGSAIHMRLLEPDNYEIFMPVATVCQATLKKGGACSNNGTMEHDGKWYCGTKSHAPEGSTTPEVYVTEAEAEMIEVLNHEVRRHPVVKYLRRFGGSELSAVAEIEGVLMKCRIDKLAEPEDGDPPIVLDIKTKQPLSCSMKQCQSAAEDYAYHVQAEVYRRVLKKLKGYDEVAVVHLFVEKGPPFDCVVIQSSEDDMLAGNNDFLSWLNVYKRGMETGQWPGVSNDIEHGLLPERALRPHLGNYR